MSIVTSPPVRGKPAKVHVKRPGERRSLSRSATRALDVLELFGDARRPLRAVEIGRVLGMHPSTTNQLLKTMVDSAHLVFDARSKTYLPSPRLADFSNWLIEIHGGGGRLRELVRDVQAQTGMVVTLTTANDLFMQIIDLAPEGEGGERGLRVSLFGSAIGSAYLAMLDDAEVARLADRARIPLPEIPAIIEGVAAIRSAGHADGASGGVDTVWSIAMPLPTDGQRVPTVLGLAGPAERVRPNLDELCRIMREAIARWVA